MLHLEYLEKCKIMYCIDAKPKVVSDLEFAEVNPLFRHNKKVYLIGSRQRDRVISTNSEQVMFQVKLISDCLNGNNSLEDIHEQGYDYKSIEVVLNKLYQAGLLESHGGTINSELDLVAHNIACIRCKSPNFLLQKICKKLVLLIPIVIVLLLILLIINLSGKKISPFSIGYSLDEIIIASVIMQLFTVLHEFGHLLVAWSEGIEVDSVNISFRWHVMPIIYVKYRGVNFLQPKIKAKLLLGGPFINFLFALIFLNSWCYLNNNIVLLISMYNFTMFMASLYPQTLSDGYFLLLLIANKPSIRVEAIKWIFSSNKSHPSKETILFIVLYIVCTLSGLISTYLVFGKTIYNLCSKFNIDVKIIMISYFICYICLVISMVKHAKRKFAK